MSARRWLVATAVPRAASRVRPEVVVLAAPRVVGWVGAGGVEVVPIAGC